MANNVIDAAIRLRDLFTPTVRSVNASLGTMKAQMAAAKQSVSGLSDKLTEHERIQKRTAKSIEQTGGKISGLSDKFALLSAPILAVATAGFKLNSDFTNGLATVSTLVDTTVVSMDDEQRAWMRNYMANGTNTRYYPFTTRIKCALCGSSFRRYSKSKSGTFAHWRCTKCGQC